MAIIASVIQYDDWEGEAPDKELIKFIPGCLATFEGSAGHGGVPVECPVTAAQQYAENKVAVFIRIIDTQSPEWSSTYKKDLYPKWPEEDDFRIRWERC